MNGLASDFRKCREKECCRKGPRASLLAMDALVSHQPFGGRRLMCRRRIETGTLERLKAGPRGRIVSQFEFFGRFT
jgi:hypothetical protein